MRRDLPRVVVRFRQVEDLYDAQHGDWWTTNGTVMARGVRVRMQDDTGSWWVWKGVEDGQDGFGQGLFAQDVDGDGRDDLVVLAPSWTDASGVTVGRMHLLWGGGL